MASAQDLRRRIKSVKNTQQITKAMKMVAAAKLRRAQEAVVASRPFSRMIKDVLGRVAKSAGGVNHPLLEVREPKNIAYIVVTADRGLCGGFNANVIKMAFNEVKSIKDPVLVAVGRKSRDFFRRRNYNIAQQYVGLGENIKFSQAQDIARFVIDKYSSAEFDVVYLFFSEFVSVMTQRPTMIKLLPVEPPQEKEEAKPVEYIYEPNAESVLYELLPKYVETTIYSALLESKAGEQAARMTAMDSATSNAADMIDRLTLVLNRARQAAITKEIAEIVGGSAALE
ncbi:ATP synthase F1, gamma subunit [Desulfofarcimen acetoxidans DSM 771]|jgi:F-type H+-transporting ATPase subunit gamma|uniref:ATP synthase gamma chain n=1 Tax=Desulfofarcimen acetoxidans (strain ATCC 49208 / DSM 771 / KCTC 5769 / VKM B-1644 / 5575) TaxID=485916 RepID=C8VZ89_DESAS|nr:ATP synthase F1 subunit gamma [Desulfofarcimen acetoxidans]ACV64834.1 ATP synthase F1, gamma subunit [Desulfofarcimen acetoxidans DSM 771]